MNEQDERIVALEQRVLELERERDEKLFYQALVARRGFLGFKPMYTPEELEPVLHAFREKYGRNPSWWEEL